MKIKKSEVAMSNIITGHGDIISQLHWANSYESAMIDRFVSSLPRGFENVAHISEQQKVIIFKEKICLE